MSSKGKLDIKRIEVLKSLIEFAEKKGIVFVPEEFLIYMWYKYKVRRGVYLRFETIMRYLREFARAGLLDRHYRFEETAFGRTKVVVYSIRRHALKAELRNMGVEI